MQRGYLETVPIDDPMHSIGKAERRTKDGRGGVVRLGITGLALNRTTHGLGRWWIPPIRRGVQRPGPAIGRSNQLQ